MSNTAIQGIYHKGRVIPQDNIPFKKDMRVIIVFTEEIEPGEERYYTQGWIEAERQATEDYKAGRIESAESVDEMFAKIERELDDD